MLQAWDIPQSEITGRLYPVSGVAAENPIVLIKGEKGEIVEPAFLALADLIKREGIALAILDPLQDLSHSPETNEVFRALGGRIRPLRQAQGQQLALSTTPANLPPEYRLRLTMAGRFFPSRVARFNRLLVPMTEAEGASGR